jgi:hypothetical protein
MGRKIVGWIVVQEKIGDNVRCHVDFEYAGQYASGIFNRDGIMLSGNVKCFAELLSPYVRDYHIIELTLCKFSGDTIMEGCITNAGNNIQINGYLNFGNIIKFMTEFKEMDINITREYYGLVKLSINDTLYYLDDSTYTGGHWHILLDGENHKIRYIENYNEYLIKIFLQYQDMVLPFYIPKDHIENHLSFQA